MIVPKDIFLFSLPMKTIRKKTTLRLSYDSYLIGPYNLPNVMQMHNLVKDLARP
jgi:hypothetical protein